LQFKIYLLGIYPMWNSVSALLRRRTCVLLRS